MIAGRRIDSDALGCLRVKIDILTDITEFRLNSDTRSLGKCCSSEVAIIDPRFNVRDFHLSQALLMLQSQCSIDHKLVLQTASAEQSYYRHRPKTSGKTILLKSTHCERVQTWGFCVEFIKEILENPPTVGQSSLKGFNASSKIVLWA